MKYYFFYLLNFLLLINLAKAQIPNKEFTTFKYNVILKSKDSIIMSDECLLYRNDNTSFFYSLNKITYQKKMIEKIEFAMRNGGKLNLGMNDGKMLTNFLPFSVIKNYKTDKIIFIEEIDEQSFGYIKDSSLKKKWVLMGDTATINNLFCRKAIYNSKNSENIAWYCTDFPIADGPFGYCDLPGLIVKVENNFGWSAILTNIYYNVSNNNVEKVPNYISTTQKDLAKLKKRNIDNLFGDRNGQKISLQKKDD